MLININYLYLYSEIENSIINTLEYTQRCK